MSKLAGLAVIALMAGLAGPAAAQFHQKVVWNFTGGSDGTQPRGDLIVGQDGALYGTTSSGGLNQSGTVFRINPTALTNSEQTLYQFTGGSDGSLPSASLLQASNGAFYGTAARDGTNNAGTVFSINPPASGSTAWTETTVWNFKGGADGAQPLGALIADRSGSGVLYGTTNFGGPSALGVIFSLTPPVGGSAKWTEQILWAFTGGSDGAKPSAGLIQGTDGTLYGTATMGGSSGAGTIFALAPPKSGSSNWGYSAIYTFSGGADGAAPMSTLTQDSAGALYGTTEAGGGGDCAQPRFQYYEQPESQTTPSYQAAYIPVGGNSCGVVFKLTRPAGEQAWTYNVIWSFQAGVDGGNPVGDLLIGSNGTVYGVTPEYGDPGPDSLDQIGDKGNVFELTPPAAGGNAYTESTLLSFTGERYSLYSRAGLTPAAGGKFYATGIFGGNTWVHTKCYGYGTVIYIH